MTVPYVNDRDVADHRADGADDGPDPGPPALDEGHRRPDHADDRTVAAVGRLSEALERIERARGHLYAFHQLMGGADEIVGDATDQLAAAGHPHLAHMVWTRLVGRNVLDGRWTFQVVEEFDDGYYTEARAVERQVRDELMDGRRHVFEAELKQQRRTRGRPGHEPVPPAGS